MKHMAKAAAPLLAVILLLAGCGGSGKDTPPQSYTLGDSSLPSLNALVTLEDGVQFQQTQDFMKYLERLIAFLLPLYNEEGKSALVIAVGCTGGQHRSVAVTKALAEFIRRKGYQASESHRDMTRA